MVNEDLRRDYGPARSWDAGQAKDRRREKEIRYRWSGSVVNAGLRSMVNKKIRIPGRMRKTLEYSDNQYFTFVS